MPEKQKRKRKGERPDGLIQRSLQLGFKPDGRPDRKYFYGHTAAEAERKRDAYKASIVSGSKFNPNTTVAEWVKIYLKTYRLNVNPAYIRNDNIPYNRLVKRLGRMRISDVRETDLQKALNETAGMSFSTVDKYRKAMKRVFEKARKNKLIQENPAEDLVMPAYEKGTHRALDSWEVELILENWDNENARAGLWVMLMLLCGLRRGEMIALNWDAVNLDARTLEVKQVAVINANKTSIEQRAKTNAGLRIIPICQALYDALNSVPIEKRQGIICLSAQGKMLTESSLRRGLETFCNTLERVANGEPASIHGRRPKALATKSSFETRRKFSFTPHDLRHTYATALYDAGVPAKAAQYFLGHSSIQITLDLYTHLSKERESDSRIRAVTYLDKWIDEQTKKALPFSSDESSEQP